MSKRISPNDVRPLSYVLSVDVDYEGSRILGVFSSLVLAQRAAWKHICERYNYRDEKGFKPFHKSIWEGIAHKSMRWELRDCDTALVVRACPTDDLLP